MLAERRRKQKFTLNPSGNNWSQDSNKFGQKMLEKMGWKSGKGLGANEDGMTEHVKVTYKSDSRGMGFKESDNQWTEHDSNFSSLLENLNTSNKTNNEYPGDNQNSSDSNDIITKIKPTSLEEKSQKSRARVHYHKFTRGKDLSRYSEKDLANIFGKKSLKPQCVSEKTSESNVSSKTNSISNSEENSNDIGENDQQTKNDGRTFGIQTVKGGSMADYFKKKLPNFGVFSNGYVIGKNGVLKKAEGLSAKQEENDYSEDERPTFGFGFSNLQIKKEENSSKFGFDFKTGFSSFVKSENDKNCAQIAQTEDIELQETKPKKKKKKNKHLELEQSTESQNVSQDDTLQGVNDSVLTIDNFNTRGEGVEKKKKKKKIKIEEIPETVEDEIAVENPNFDYESNQDELGQMQDNNKYEVKRKDKKKRKYEEANENIDLNEESKPKKSRKEVNAVDNPVFNNGMEIDGLTENTEDNNKFEVKRKDKKKKIKDKKSSEVEIEVEETVAIDNPNFLSEDEPSFLENSASTELNNKYEVKRKDKEKKKRKREDVDDSFKNNDMAVDNPNFSDLNESVVFSEISESTNEYEVKRKDKKKKKNKQKVNEDCDVNNVENADVACDLIINAVAVTPVTTPKIKSALKEESNFGNEFEMPRRIESKIRRKSVRFSEINQEHIIPPKGYDEVASLEDIKNRNELFEINTLVIENSLEEQKKDSSNNGHEKVVGFLNTAFDLKSIDKVSFYEKSYESKIPEKKVVKNGKKLKLTQVGQDNVVFDQKATEIEENVDCISKTIDNYEAEVENDINEKKAELKTNKKRNNINSTNDNQIENISNSWNEPVEFSVGMANISSPNHKKLPDGTQLGFQLAKFKTQSFRYDRAAQMNDAKKSYKHLIVGDVNVAFRNTNLHAITGYGSPISRINGNVSS